VRRAEGDILTEKKKVLEGEIKKLREMLHDRESALPAHSVRPHQIQAIEELEDKIEIKEKEYRVIAGALIDS
jgi:predicted transcriptional regulator of viral defense system